VRQIDKLLRTDRFDSSHLFIIMNDDSEGLSAEQSGSAPAALTIQ
jgi:hypothetical protein